METGHEATERANVAEQDKNNDGDTFDYVIVGSGAAGSVLCRRLTEDPGVTVCVLECGPPDRHPFIHIPAGFIKMLFNPTYTWQFQTEPGDAIGGRRIPTTQGRTLGGSSSINGMIYNRGQRADFDSWAQRGNRGWGYVDVLPYFKRTERRIGLGDDRIHGRAGGLPVTDMDWFHPVCDAFMEGAQELGIPRCEDYNSGDRQAGVGYFQRLINRGYRHSAARVFLHPARRGGQLDVRTDARASRILFDGTRATGVRYVDDRDRTTVREVLRAARGDRVQRYRQHREAVADIRRRTSGIAARSRRAGDRRSAGGRELPRSLRGAHRRAGEKHPHHQRNVQGHRPRRADRALGTGAALDPGGQSVAGALVLEVGRHAGTSGSARRVLARQL